MLCYGVTNKFYKHIKRLLYHKLLTIRLWFSLFENKLLHSLTNNFVKETKAKQINGFHNYPMPMTEMAIAIIPCKKIAISVINRQIKCYKNPCIKN